MSKKIFNLLTPVIVREVEEILSHYSDHPYQQAFANPELRDELIAFVLNSVPGNYVVFDEASERPPSTDFRPSAHDRETIDIWIHQGIQHIFERYAEAIPHHIPDVDDPGLLPSQWFG